MAEDMAASRSLGWLPFALLGCGRLFLSPGPPSANIVVVAQAISAVFEKVSFDFNSVDRV